MRILVTGGTVFVSRFAAEYFSARGHDVAVLNRGSRQQSPGVRHICRDRCEAGLNLRQERFDAVLDVTAYNARDVDALLDAVGDVPLYIMISSSAVYPESLPRPFREEMPTGPNAYWGAYGTDKIAAEQRLQARNPGAYILRPPYLYGPGNELHREAFVFDCAEQERPFYLPGDGSMPLQFFHVRDLCRLMEQILLKRPEIHVMNTGNPETVTIREWVTACYAAAGRVPEFVSVKASVPQRSYFPFLNYAYQLDVSVQQKILPRTTPLAEGLQESYAWYAQHRDMIRRKPMMAFIDEQLTI